MFGGRFSHYSLMILSALFVGTWALNAAAKTTVCAMTFNSENEFAAMKRALGDSIHSVELVEFSKEVVDGRTRVNFEPRGWLERACQRQVRCDVVIVSAHFAGDFYNEKYPDLRVGLEEFERASCSEQCHGVFSHAKEVYLLGCNTMSREEITGFDLLRLGDPDRPAAPPPATAQLKYSHFERARISFPNAGRIYGYPSIGPTGQAVEASFFQMILRQKAHFERLASVNPRELITQGPSPHPLLVRSFGADHEPSLRRERKRVCQMAFGVDYAARLQAATELVLQGNGIKHLHQLSELLVQAGRSAKLEEFSRRNLGQELVGRLSQWRKPIWPIAVRLQAIAALHSLAVLSLDQAAREAGQILRELTDTASERDGAAGAVCSVKNQVPFLPKAAREGLSDRAEHGVAIEIIDCLRLNDPIFVRALHTVATNDTRDYRRNQACFALHRLGEYPSACEHLRVRVPPEFWRRQ